MNPAKPITSTQAAKTPFVDKICPGCGQQFLYPSRLRRHQPYCHKGQLPTCKICDATFSTMFGLNAHSKVHVATRPDKCSICDNAYANKGDLRRHIRLKHTKNQNSQSQPKPEKSSPALFECHLCPHYFKSRDQLQHHRAIHEAGADVKLPCPKCDAPFGSHGTLRRHLKLKHSEDLSFGFQPCPSCGKMYSNQYTLQNHIRNMHK